MSEFVEKSCVIEHGGKKFESGGAMQVGKHMTAYLKKTSPTVESMSGGKKWLITDWHGNVLSDEVRIINTKPIWNGRFSNTLYYLRFKYGGRIYSGTSGGDGTLIKARITKLNNLFSS